MIRTDTPANDAPRFIILQGSDSFFQKNSCNMSCGGSPSGIFWACPAVVGSLVLFMIFMTIKTLI